MSTENSPQVWRVVVACDEVQPHTHTREVDVYRNHLGWFTSETTSLGLATSHAAVMEHVHEKRWPVVEIVAPGQPTRAELEARNADLSRDRDTALAAALDLAADRDATRAILRAPRCSNCAEIATRKSTITDTVWCDGHAPAAEWLSADLPHAAALRSLMKESPR